ncbi:MAG: transcription elongation factor GreA [Alphaproteobacteria bacterium]|nr:transcription elongation factor GreA [Alphaproteobacteria bacterium]
MEKIPMTAAGYQRLQNELQHLKLVERPAIIQAISEARLHGDLSENAEYHTARERQGFIEGRIAELENKLPRVEVIDITKMKGGRIVFGATVTLVDVDNDKESVYQIVGEDESNIDQGLLSISAPLARGLIGKSIGDEVEVVTPNGSKAYEILKVEFI